MLEAGADTECFFLMPTKLVAGHCFSLIEIYIAYTNMSTSFIYKKILLGRGAYMCVDQLIAIYLSISMDGIGHPTTWLNLIRI